MSFLFRTIIVAASIATASSIATAQAPDQAAAMKQMQDRMKVMATPGPRHAELASFLGKWDVEIAMIMPGAPATRSKATGEYSWVIQGRWMGQRITGQFMGGPFESFAIIGFDNYAKNHVVASVSSMDTSMLMSRGLIVDPSHRVTAVYGTLDEYVTDELHKPYKAVTRKLDDNRHVMEIWDLGIGDAGAKVLEYTFTRRK
jgi:Protein of unknown function (DUF1579)